MGRNLIKRDRYGRWDIDSRAVLWFADVLIKLYLFEDDEDKYKWSRNLRYAAERVYDKIDNAEAKDRCMLIAARVRGV